MLDNANVLSLNSDDCLFFVFSFNGGSATVGITNIPSSWAREGTKIELYKRRYCTYKPSGRKKLNMNNNKVKSTQSFHKIILFN